MVFGGLEYVDSVPSGSSDILVYFSNVDGLFKDEAIPYFWYHLWTNSGVKSGPMVVFDPPYMTIHYPLDELEFAAWDLSLSLSRMDLTEEKVSASSSGKKPTTPTKQALAVGLPSPATTPQKPSQ